MFSTFGQLFRVTTFGESHGPAIGCVIDGCPSAMCLDLDAVQRQLARRRPGQSKLVSPRKELDRVEILSGLFEGRTLGTPLAMVIRNDDVDSTKYEAWKDTYRPSHADFTYEAKFGIRDWRGGGRASARETAARVAAGAVAEQWLNATYGIEIVAWVSAVGRHEAEVDATTIDRSMVDETDVRCPSAEAAERMRACIQEARRSRDAVGGVVTCVARNVPVGLGEPVFDKAEARLAGAMLGLPAAKGFESGSGFGGARMLASEHNDAFRRDESGRIVTATNYSGGIQGGITNGMPITLRVAFKPVATIPQPQPTVDREGNETSILMTGRHDPCVVPRAVPLVEAMTALVIADLALIHRARAHA